MDLTSAQFEELANLYGEIADGKQRKREHVLAKRVTEAESLTPVINAAQDRINALLPDDLSEADKTTLSQSFTLYHKNPATLSRKSIDRILPGFAAYAESRLSDGLTVDLTKPLARADAPVTPPASASSPAPAAKLSAPSVISPSEDDIREFGEAEAAFIARSTKNTHPNIDEIINRYREALRNRGPVKGVNYTTDDTRFLISSPDNVTPRVQGISGREQSITDDYIELMLLALPQYDMKKKNENPYGAPSIHFGSAKAQLRSSSEQYQALCDELFKLSRTSSSPRDEAEKLFESILSKPTEEDLRELESAFAEQGKIKLYENNSTVFNLKSDNTYSYGFLYNEEYLVAFCNTVGDIEAGKKGGFLKSATPDRFLGINQGKLQAYKNHLEAELYRIRQEATNEEYESIFIVKKQIPDFLLLESELKLIRHDTSLLCSLFNDNGGAEIVPDLLHHYQVTSVLEISDAIGQEIRKKHAFNNAVDDEYYRTKKRDEAWNEHVLKRTDGENIHVRTAVRKEHIRETSRDERLLSAENSAIGLGLEPSRFLKPKKR